MYVLTPHSMISPIYPIYLQQNGLKVIFLLQNIKSIYTYAQQQQTNIHKQ